MSVRNQTKGSPAPVVDKPLDPFERKDSGPKTEYRVRQNYAVKINDRLTYGEGEVVLLTESRMISLGRHKFEKVDPEPRRSEVETKKSEVPAVGARTRSIVTSRRK